MKLLIIIVFAIAIYGCSNVSEKDSAATNISKAPVDSTPRVTGIGGVFFKSKDPKVMKEWYQKNLGMKTDAYGTLFEFRLANEPDKKGYLQWSPFSEKTKYFEPSEKEFMINYRVVNLEALLVELDAAGVEIVDTMETYEYGKFVHIMDPEGNKLELWEPVDSVFTETEEDPTTH